MRNKGFFWFVTTALALACIYQLSFTWATSGVETDAEDYAQDKIDSILDPSFNVTQVSLEGELFDSGEQIQKTAVCPGVMRAWYFEGTERYAWVTLTVSPL